MKKPTRVKNEKGAAAVEFALVLPLLLLLVFGGIEFGLVLFNKQVITNASREAARAGIVQSPRPDDPTIEGIALDYCQDFLVTFDPAAPPPTVAISHPADPEFSDDLIVTVVYRYEFLLLPNLRNLFGGDAAAGLDLVATTTMRYE